MLTENVVLTANGEAGMFIGTTALPELVWIYFPVKAMKICCKTKVYTL